MLTINDTHYTAVDFTEYHQLFSTMDIFSIAKNIAVCLTDNMTWLALCSYAQKRQFSVMPIHPSTPLNTAEKLSAKAGCSALFYQNLETIIAINTPPQQHTQAGLIQMSSGTTGEPKCIKRSWEAIEVEVKNYISVFPQAQTKTPVIACPVTHSYGLICGVMVALARGQQPIIITNINPKYLIKTLLNVASPLLYSSPTMLEGIMRLWPKDSQLHAAMTSGTIMSTPLFEVLRHRVTHLYQQYGCSEAGCISISQQLKYANDIGIPLPHISIDGSINPNKPAEFIAKVNINDNMQIIHTQDIGFLEKNKHGGINLRFIARLDDTIIVAGLNVYPQEIEDIILTHPQIIDAVIFKVNDHFAGQRVCLQYQTEQNIDEIQMRQWCREQLASYQVPHYLQQVSAITRLANGKVNRKQIAINFQKSLQQASQKPVQQSPQKPVQQSPQKPVKQSPQKPVKQPA